MNLLHDIIRLVLDIGTDAYKQHTEGVSAEKIATDASDKLRKDLQRRLARARFDDAQRNGG